MADMVKAEDVVLQAQKIATLVQLATFIKAVSVGVAAHAGIQVQLQVLDRQRTGLFLNSQLLVGPLTEEFNKLGQELTNAGVDLEELLAGEKQRFDAVYGISNN